MKTFFVTLNWNTSDLFRDLVRTVEQATPEPHTWVVVENGSDDKQVQQLYETCKQYFPNTFGVFGEDRETWGKPGASLSCVIVKALFNLGCVKGHNLAFDMCKALAGDEPYNIVMVDTDVEVYDEGWLTWVYNFVANQPNEIGIVGLEHSAVEKCAGAVALDKNGNWYLHKDQTFNAVPVRAESVGLGLAVLLWPVPQLRFDEERFILYYKQDDDFCFQVRADGRQVWAFPIDMVHWGSRGIKSNDYRVTPEVQGYEQFDSVKRGNQKRFAEKWQFALRDRRPNLEAEQKHLDQMEAMFYERRISGGRS